MLVLFFIILFILFFFKQKTAYEIKECDWSSDVCSSDLLFFPCGQWRSWLTSIDIELLQRMNCQILKVHEVLEFEPFYDLKNYANTLYNLRKKAESPFEKTAFKLLLNSLYGKFAEGEEKRSMIVNPETIERDKWEMLFPGAWIRETLVPIPHRHVPVSAHIKIGRAHV